jgi:glutamyl-tRNA synthetase
VVRMRVPDADIAFDDLVRGPVRFAAAHVPDYVIVRANGEPLYTLVNPVDDSLMEITHVLRGEDLLPSTPRQIVLYDALKQIGVGSGRTPAFGHLPTVLGEGNRRLSKRDKGSGLAEYQQKGYLPEGLLNYLALLGWGNAAHIRLLSPGELTENLVPFLAAAGLINEPPLPAEQDKLAAATPLIQERMNTLSEAVGLLAFLFLPDDKITIAPDAGLSADSIPTLKAAYEALAALNDFDAGAVESALRTALVDKLGLKPRLAFGPVRAAVTGSRVSPPLFESIELLGRRSTLARTNAALTELGEPAYAESNQIRGTAPISRPAI